MVQEDSEPVSHLIPIDVSLPVLVLIENSCLASEMWS